MTDAKAIKEYVEKHPEGVRIRMIDGAAYDIPHRDFVWFFPGFGENERSVASRWATHFFVADAENEDYLVVNAMLVKDVAPLPSNGNGHKKRSTRSRK